MSYKPTARSVYAPPQESQSTTALFVRNHSCPEHLLDQLKTLYGRGHIEETIHLIECIVRNENPLISSADLFVLHAKALIEVQGFSVDALCALKQATLLEPENKDANELEMLCGIHELLQDGLYEKAVSGLKAIMESHPENMIAVYMLGHHLFWKSGNQAYATELLEKAVSMRPSFLKAWVSLGMAYKKNKCFEQADEAFTQCLDLDQNEANHEYYKKHQQSL